MTDLTLAPLDIGIELAVPAISPFMVTEILEVGVELPSAVAARNWSGLVLPAGRLNRLSPNESIVSGIGVANLPFTRDYQENVEQTEASIDSLASAVIQIQAALAEAAEAKKDAADAQDAAAASIKEVELQGSNADPLGVLTADTAGTVTIAAHSRRYSDTRIVAVDGGTLTGNAVGSVVRPYYDDQEQSGGAVIWAAANDGEVVSQTNGRHLVGNVTIPTEGSPPASGNPSTPPGFNIDIGEVLA